MASQAVSQASQRLLSLSEVCSVLSVSRSTVFRLAARGELPRVRIGGLTRYRSADIQALIERYAPSNVERPAGELASDTATLEDGERRSTA